MGANPIAPYELARRRAGLDTCPNLILLQINRKMVLVYGRRDSSSAEALKIDLNRLLDIGQRFLLGLPWRDASRQQGHDVNLRLSLSKRLITMIKEIL